MMRKFCLIVLCFIVATMTIPFLNAQSLKGMSLNGATGLFSIPTARIGWENSDFGLDLGYHTISENKASHIPAVSISLLKWVEISGAFDIQPGDNQSDIILGAKIQFPIQNTALAIGGNFQLINFEQHNDEGQIDIAGQIYIAVTYSGNFFTWPAQTTFVLGSTFMKNYPENNIDFGMGFDMILLPSVLNNLVHWITDFANFSYSVDPFGADHSFRGVLNTGIRIDLSAIPALSRFKFVVDIILTDAFDSNRAYSVGLVFGIPVN
jgi:hypothetical protein